MSACRVGCAARPAAGASHYDEESRSSRKKWPRRTCRGAGIWAAIARRLRLPVLLLTIGSARGVSHIQIRQLVTALPAVGHSRLRCAASPQARLTRSAHMLETVRLLGRAEGCGSDRVTGPLLRAAPARDEAAGG